MADPRLTCAAHPHAPARAVHLDSTRPPRAICEACESKSKRKLSLLRAAHRYVIRVDETVAKRGVHIQAYLRQGTPVLFIRRRRRASRSDRAASRCSACPTCGVAMSAARFCSLECARVMPEVVALAAGRTRQRKQREPHRALPPG